MKLIPGRGLLFLTPIDKIEPSNDGVGFGATKQKQKPEHPYRFRVAAVGRPLPVDGLWVDSEVNIGDVITIAFSNQTMRERISEGAGFLIDEEWYYPIDFREILGVEEPRLHADRGSGSRDHQRQQYDGY